MTTPIHELMARDPESLSDADIDAIVADLRAKRKAFNTGNLSAGKAPTAAQKKKEEAAKAVLGGTSLSDLGL